MPLDYRTLARDAFVGFLLGLALLGCVAQALH
jgi:hypothetical protein